MVSRIIALRLALAIVAATLLTVPAAACPPQISVRRPDSSTPGSAFVLVYASRGCVRGALAVAGTAEGLVDGQRRSMRLAVEAADGDSVYRVRRQWPNQGVWVLRLVVTVGDYGATGSTATALVGVNAAGESATIREQDPARRTIPVITDADLERMLRSLAA